jgi:putative dehydrogenase
MDIERVIGIVGLGIMGSAMARNLLSNGYAVVGYDPSDEAADRLCSAGGEALSSARAVAQRADVLIISLPTVAVFEQVMAELAQHAPTGQVIIETSTMPVEAKQRAHARLSQAGQILLDCTVSGTGAQAANKDLVVFGSGDAAAFDSIRPVLGAFSRRSLFLGKFGNGSTMKFIANHLVTIHNAAAAEAFALAGSAGLDLGTVFEALADSAATSRMFQLRGPMMVLRRYDKPTATIGMYMKDLDVISDFAARLRCPTPLFTAATQLYYAALHRGQGELDTASVCSVLEDMAGVQRGNPDPGADAASLPVSHPQ